MQRKDRDEKRKEGGGLEEGEEAAAPLSSNSLRNAASHALESERCGGWHATARDFTTATRARTLAVEVGAIRLRWLRLQQSWKASSCA